MKQQVDITLKLSLWLDATMDEDAIVTHVRASLPNAFGEELIAIQNPVDILDVKQEAEIYGEANPQSGKLNAPWTLHFDRDGTEDVAVICDAKGEELARSRPFWRPEDNDPTPPTLAAMRVMKAAPKLLEALERYFSEMEIGDAGQREMEEFEALAREAFAEATDDSIGRVV